MKFESDGMWLWMRDFLGEGWCGGIGMTIVLFDRSFSPVLPSHLLLLRERLKMSRYGEERIVEKLPGVAFRLMRAIGYGWKKVRKS